MIFFSCSNENIITLFNEDTKVEITEIVNNSPPTKYHPFYLTKEDVIYFFNNAEKVEFTEIHNNCIILDSYVIGKIYSNYRELEFKIQLIDFGMIKYEDNIEWYICNNFADYFWNKYYDE